MSAGALDQRVKLWRREGGVSSTGSGAQVEEFVLVAKAYARVTPLRGSESFVAGTRFADATHAFRLNYRAALDQSWRIEWRGQQYDVLEVLPAGHRLRQWIDVVAQASPAENPA